MKRIALFGTISNEDALPNLVTLIQQLTEGGAEVLIEEEFWNALTERMLFPEGAMPIFQERDWADIAYVICFGGDGTFLRTVHQVNQLSIPILAINGGHLGFLTDLDAAEALNYVDRLLSEDFRIEERCLLSVTVEGQSLGYVLNEVFIQRRETGSMINVEAHINDDFLADYAADGLIVAPPSGSTAYSLSVQGPIVVPQCPVILITPIAPHSLNMRPLVLPDDATIRLKVFSRSSTFMMVLDGRLSVFPTEVSIVIRQAEHRVRMIRLGRHSFYDTLRDKLMWGKNLR